MKYKLEIFFEEKEISLDTKIGDLIMHLYENPSCIHDVKLIVDKVKKGEKKHGNRKI